jgi:DNA repair protein RecO (recombination protein O)
MEWREEGVLLAVRKHGENAAIIDVFTSGHGLHSGVVRGGAGRRMGPVLQPGAQLDLTWRARLEDHLGAFSVEPVKSRAADILGDALALAGLSAVCALLRFTLPDREPHPALYERSLALLDALAATGWPRVYLRWELALLDEMGFGLDLDRCAVTRRSDGLAFISPRTGRAVRADSAGDWADRLLPLPDSLRPGSTGADLADILAGLQVTGHFLTQNLAQVQGDRPVPAARMRFVDLLARRGEI